MKKFIKFIIVWLGCRDIISHKTASCLLAKFGLVDV